MYELEIYDKAYMNESRLIFGRKLSPREILQVVNKWSFYEKIRVDCVIIHHL